jgi:hypothetical protein
MKKLYTITTLLIIIFSGKVFAQPTYTQTSFPAAGTVLTSIMIDPTGLSPGNAGANQTWDFSTAVLTGTSSMSNVVTPASTPYASSFPTASLAQSQVNAGGSAAYVYYSLSASYAEMIGFVSVSPSATMNYSFSDPRRVMNFPWTYNSTFTDASAGIAIYVIGGYTVNQYRRGTVTYTADGYGTCINPLGMNTNVLRLKTVETTVDSSVFVGLPVPATVTESNVVSYGWSGSAPFFQFFSITYDSVFVNGAFSSANSSASYMDNSSSVSELSPRVKPISIYPNPSSKNDFIHLTAHDLKPGETQFIVEDMQGRVVKHNDFVIMPAPHHTVDVEVSDIPAGIYSVRLQQKNNVFSSRFIRQ